MCSLRSCLGLFSYKDGDRSGDATEPSQNSTIHRKMWDSNTSVTDIGVSDEAHACVVVIVLNKNNRIWHNLKIVKNS